MNEPPQNWMPSPRPPGVASWPTRLHATTYTPFAIACERCMVRHASYCAAPSASRSAGCQPIAVG